jgi:phosphoglycolate phosphatase-like HAD superfamily hydrolase
MSKQIPAKAVIFDVEGTLVDCVAFVLESWRLTLQEGGYAFSHEQLQPYSGMDGEWMLEQLIPQEAAATRQRLLKEQGERYRKDFIARAEAFAGVLELFDYLKGKGLSLGIATTCKADELAIYDEQMQVTSLADSIVCGESIQHGKPDPQLLQLSLKMLAVATPSVAVSVGDTPFDAIAAKAAGSRSLGVRTGGFSALSLHNAGHEHVFAEVRQVSQLWKGAAAIQH